MFKYLALSLMSLSLLLAPAFGCYGGSPDEDDDGDVAAESAPLIAGGTCSGDATCAENQYCRKGTCVADKPLGGTCVRETQCETGFCFNGVCSDLNDPTGGDPTGGGLGSGGLTGGNGYQCHLDSSCFFCSLDGDACLISAY